METLGRRALLVMFNIAPVVDKGKFVAHDRTAATFDEMLDASRMRMQGLSGSEQEAAQASRGHGWGWRRECSSWVTTSVKSAREALDW